MEWKFVVDENEYDWNSPAKWVDTAGWYSLEKRSKRRGCTWTVLYIRFSCCAIYTCRLYKYMAMCGGEELESKIFSEIVTIGYLKGPQSKIFLCVISNWSRKEVSNYREVEFSLLGLCPIGRTFSSVGFFARLGRLVLGLGLSQILDPATTISPVHSSVRIRHGFPHIRANEPHLFPRLFLTGPCSYNTCCSHMCKQL